MKKLIKRLARELWARNLISNLALIRVYQWAGTE